MKSTSSQAGRDSSRSRFLAPALIIAAVVATSALGGLATDPDSSWYRDLDRPEWQPASSVFAPVWTLLYVLIATSMIILWHRTDGRERKHLFVLWGANLVLNLAWTVIFFRSHSPLAAGLEILLLEATTVILIFRTWPFSRFGALILVPYALWVAFATALTWTIWTMN